MGRGKTMKYRVTLSNTDGLSSPTLNSLSIGYQDKTNRPLSDIELSFQKSHKSKTKKDIDSDQKIYSQRIKNVFQGGDRRLIDGTVKVYKNGKKIKAIDVDGDGEWKKAINIRSNKKYDLKFKFFDMHGTELYSETYQMEVDDQDPVFSDFPDKNTYYKPLQTLNFPAADNDQIKKYKIYFQGRIFNHHTPEFTLPGNLPPGAYPLTVKAYDKAGNTAKQSVDIRIGAPPAEEDAASAEQ